MDEHFPQSSQVRKKLPVTSSQTCNVFLAYSSGSTREHSGVLKRICCSRLLSNIHTCPVALWSLLLTPLMSFWKSLFCQIVDTTASSQSTLFVALNYCAAFKPKSPNYSFLTFCCSCLSRHIYTTFKNNPCPR